MSDKRFEICSKLRRIRRFRMLGNFRQVFPSVWKTFSRNTKVSLDTRFFFLYPNILVARGYVERSEKLSYIRSFRSAIHNFYGCPNLLIRPTDIRVASRKNPHATQFGTRVTCTSCYQITESLRIRKPGIRKLGLPALVLKADTAEPTERCLRKGNESPGAAIRIARFFSSEQFNNNNAKQKHFHSESNWHRINGK